MITINPADCYITVTCEPEYSPVEGNASAIDPETDKAIADSINEQLESGNEWAWCVVKVTAKYKMLTSSTYLGACSYTSERDFVENNSDYYEDMVQECCQDIKMQLNDLFQSCG